MLDFPCLEEQKKISDFLIDLDTKIQHIDKELVTLKEFKKGLLQGMFV
jgi:type I restriction enzyme, S subunit